MTRYVEKLSSVEELLLLALRHERTLFQRKRIYSIYQERGDEAVFECAAQNKVIPMVAHGLMESVPDDHLASRWSKSHNEAEQKLQGFFKELDRLALLAEQKGIRFAAIENGGIARGVQHCRGCFASSDLELLLEKVDMSQFELLLFEEGFTRGSRERCASENSNQWDRDIIGWDNYFKTLADGNIFWLNIQWRPVLRRWIPMEQGLTTRDLIDRSVLINGSESRVRILAPEDNLLVCALHVASHSYVRGIGLRLQLDVDHLVRNVNIDWPKFLNLVRRHRAKELVFLSLAIPASMLDTPIPEDVLIALIPSERRRGYLFKLISYAGVFNRHTHKFTFLQFVRLEIALSRGMMDGLRRVFIPSADWIREGYILQNNRSLIYCYLHRIFSLAKRRHA